MIFSSVYRRIKTVLRYMNYTPPWLINWWRWMLRFWFFTSTKNGKLILFSLVLTGYAGLISPDIPIHNLFSLLLSLYVFSWLAGYFLKRNCSIYSRNPEQVCTGEKFQWDVTITNESNDSVPDAGCDFFRLPPSIITVSNSPSLYIPPKSKTKFSIKLHALKRGIYDLGDIIFYSGFPFHLNRWEIDTHDSGMLKVFPHFHPIIDMDIPVGKLYQPGGIALTSGTGESPEYTGNREYVPGDPVKRIDFRSWARLAKPAVREYQEEYYCRIALVLDTFIDSDEPAPKEGFENFEAAISLSAAIADFLFRGEYIIDIFAAGSELYVFRAGRNLAYLDNILEVLACIEECRESPFSDIAPDIAEEMSRITSTICVLLDWDHEREMFVRKIIEAGSSTRIFIIRDGETAEPFAHCEDWTGRITCLTPTQIMSGEMEFL